MEVRVFTEILKDDIARQSAALSVMARISRFVDDLDDRGFGVTTQVVPLAAGVIKVAFEIQCPAGEVDLPAPAELVDAPADAEPKLPPLPAAAPPAPKPAPRKPGPVVAKQGAPWSDAEKQKLLEMLDYRIHPEEIARRLGRPLPGTKMMITKLMKAKALSAAKVKSKSKPAPKPETLTQPVEKTVPAPVQKPDPAPILHSPLDVAETSAITTKMMEAHLTWLYGGRLDPDQIACDLEMVELLLSTGSAQVVAQEFDWPKAQVVDRFYLLRHGHPVSLDLQQKLLDALRAIKARAT